MNIDNFNLDMDFIEEFKKIRDTDAMNFLQRDYYLNNKYVFQFWTDDNSLTENRIRNLENFESTTGMKNILIHPSNLDQFVLPFHPLHKTYPYLSAVHKSDYLRAYFGFFYGGGYMYIKECWGNWKSSWHDLITCTDKNVFMNSHPNPDMGCVPCSLSQDVKDNYAKIPSVCIFLSKQFNPIMYDWLIEIEKILDERAENITNNPMRNPYEYGGKYSICWNEIGARLLHRIYYEKYLKTSSSLLTMPFLNRNEKNYR